jgi:hypothetical protein
MTTEFFQASIIQERIILNEFLREITVYYLKSIRQKATRPTDRRSAKIQSFLIQSGRRNKEPVYKETPTLSQFSFTSFITTVPCRILSTAE